MWKKDSVEKDRQPLWDKEMEEKKVLGEIRRDYREAKNSNNIGLTKKFAWIFP